MNKKIKAIKADKALNPRPHTQGEAGKDRVRTGTQVSRLTVL